MTWSETDVASLASISEKIVIDVREEDEYVSGHIPGAINIPLSVFAESFVEIPHAATVFIACQVGGRSARACEFVSQQSEYSSTQFVNVTGGTGAWILEGYDIVVGNQPS
jgi:rhodanese-related sulfurtransferase